MDIAAILEMIRDGKSAVEFGAAFHDLVQQVEMTGKPGRITWQIQVKPSGANQAKLDDKISVVKPESDREVTIVYIDEDTGTISRRHPKQRELPFEAPR